MGRAGDSFAPLLSDLNDIQVALDHDLTSNGVKSIRRLATRAQRQMGSLHDDLNELIREIAETRGLLASTVSR